MGTLSMNFGGGGASLEEVVRPVVTSTLILRRAPVVTADELQEAEIRWGGPSDFAISSTNPRDTSDGTRVIVVPRDPEDPEETTASLLLELQEVAYESEEVTITAEGGGDASITEERKTQSDYQLPPEFLDMFAKASGVRYANGVLRLKFMWKN